MKVHWIRLKEKWWCNERQVQKGYFKISTIKSSNLMIMGVPISDLSYSTDTFFFIYAVIIALK